jgi:hypothetical protein
MNSLPLFKKELLSYAREEKNGYWTIIPKLHGETRELMINNTSKLILELADGKKDIEEIVAILKDKYPLITINKLSEDTEYALALFSRLSIVQWTGENPFLFKRERYTENEVHFSIGTEDDLLAIYNFFKLNNYNASLYEENKSTIIAYRSPFNMPYSYEELALRQKLFNNIEDFFLLWENDKLIGIISFALPAGPFYAAAFETVICPKEHIKDLLQYAKDTLPFIAVKDIAKIKIYFDTKLKNTVLLDLLIAEGFQQEAVVRNEFGFDSEASILSFIYNSEIIKEVQSSRRYLKVNAEV